VHVVVDRSSLSPPPALLFLTIACVCAFACAFVFAVIVMATDTCTLIMYGVFDCAVHPYENPMVCSRQSTRANQT
jgi:hypothetical protein